MALPTLGMTFQDMILRVAEYLGVASYSGATAAIPTDTQDLELCKRLVNDGYRRFLDERAWRFLTQTFSLTMLTSPQVATDTSRYFAPDGFSGHLMGPWTYASGLGQPSYVEMVDEAMIRQFKQIDTSTGPPRYCAHRPVPDADVDPTKNRWEVDFWPAPDTGYVLTARGRVYGDAMTSLTDKSKAGFQHDASVVAAAMAQAEVQRTGSVGTNAQAYAEALARSIKMDDQSVPRRLGDYGGRGERSGIRRPYTGVDFYTNLNGVTYNF